MSKTLNLIDILLTTGRHLVLMGRFTEALDPLTKLSRFRSLPDPVNEELQALLADIHLQHQKYKQARRHLTAALAIRPLHAEYHYLMAVAIHEDEEADPKRAEMYYARAVELEPEQGAYWIDFGSYLFTMGRGAEGLKALRKASVQGNEDADILGEVAAILRREGHADEATAMLRTALFHNHGSPPFRRVWQQHQFQLIHAEQQKKKSAAADPVILPFVGRPTQGKYLELGKKTFRIDQAEPLSEPKEKTPAPFRRPPRKG